MPSSSTYGIVKPSIITADDVEIFYNYKPFRNSEEEEYSKWMSIDSNSVFSPVELSESDIDDKRLVGMYNLKLPVSIFGAKGYYTVYIKPREYKCQISDVGTLLAYPDIRGLVINSKSLGTNNWLLSNDNLVGYRVEYFGYQGTKLVRQDYHRVVTSSNLCEIVGPQQYRFNNSGSLSFITVTPSTAPSFKANATPYIGTANQNISFVNTKFDPVSIDIHMVEHDIETLSIMLEGEQVRNLDSGRVTTYNFNGEPYNQVEFMTVKDNYTNTNIAEVKINKNAEFDASLPIETLKNI